ncbi:hypothetical protein [Roseibacillus persicicus]|uniref:Uncharacterized protein n=1 Tax=Roseibacillus persicicus TaxID=454148 RepID=A0A918TQP2_9BACT|nr:hypothetical protein [Roseibacillus persicicus]GHC58413.1 hypothetical protein GCM10007100_26750 [Roseibacillus persicicus]
MSATNDTPLKRFTAFWVVLGAFLLFGIIALILAPLTNTPEVTAADEAGATRRLAIRELVEEEQAKNLAMVENGDKIQAPPAEIFGKVGAQLASIKPQAVKEDRFRDPALVAEEAPAEQEDASDAPAATETAAPAESEAAPEPADSSDQ